MNINVCVCVVNVKWLYLYGTFIQNTSVCLHPFPHTPMAASYNAKCWPYHREQFGVRCLAQGHFNMRFEALTLGLPREPKLHHCVSLHVCTHLVHS